MKKMFTIACICLRMQSSYAMEEIAEMPTEQAKAGLSAEEAERDYERPAHVILYDKAFCHTKKMELLQGRITQFIKENQRVSVSGDSHFFQKMIVKVTKEIQLLATDLRTQKNLRNVEKIEALEKWRRYIRDSLMPLRSDMDFLESYEREAQIIRNILIQEERSLTDTTLLQDNVLSSPPNDADLGRKVQALNGKIIQKDDLILEKEREEKELEQRLAGVREAKVLIKRERDSCAETYVRTAEKSS